MTSPARRPSTSRLTTSSLPAWVRCQHTPYQPATNPRGARITPATSPASPSRLETCWTRQPSGPSSGPYMRPHAHAVQGHPLGPMAGPERAGLGRSTTAHRGLRSREAHGLTQFFLGSCALPSILNVGEWCIALGDHSNMTLVDHIEFGFPSNYSVARVPTPTFTEPQGGSAHAHHIAEYVKTELHEGALLSAFDVPPSLLGPPTRTGSRASRSSVCVSRRTGPRGIHLEHQRFPGLRPVRADPLAQPSSAS